MQRSADFPLPAWQRALNFSRVRGEIKRTPADFDVTEILGFAPSGDGEHDFLLVEKESCNTAWIAEMLARHASVRPVDVGFSGRKDRFAVTRQWFSVRRPSAAGTDWSKLAIPGARILQVDRHDRKLRTGSHRANRFRIAVRGSNATSQDVAHICHRIQQTGVPNYFGQQRFGRNGSNLDLAAALFGGKRLSRNKRNIAVSAARSYLFNQILHARVVDGSWDKALPGEAFNLDGTNSVFSEEKITDELELRVASLDLHPTAALWGEGKPLCGESIAAFERNVVANSATLTAGLEKLRVRKARRAMRLVVRELTLELKGDTLWLDFSLRTGGFATTVLREILTTPDDDESVG